MALDNNNLASESQVLPKLSKVENIMTFLLSETERIDILILRGYGDKQRSYQEVCDIYNNLHPDKQIKKNVVFRTVEGYRMTRSVKNRTRSRRPKSATTDDKKLDVLLSIQENAKQSTI